MSNTDSFSLADFQQFLDSKKNMLDAVLVQTYEDFVTVLYQDIDDCIREMETGRAIRQKDGEERLTEDFRLFLVGKGYDAKRETYINGHCDLIVQDNKYLWLGEAKIHSGYDYLKKGFNQLVTRYSPGTNDANQGGLLIYIIKQSKAAEILAEWKKRLSKCPLENYVEENCSNRPNLAFFSTHCHEVSGLPFKVRHMAVVLHFDPKDRK